MGREIGSMRLLVNGGFVLVVLALAGFGAGRVASRQWRVQPTFRVQADFATIGGVDAGARVRVQGMDAGVVEAVLPPAAPGRPVRLVLRIDERLRALVRADAVARIVTEGVVGSKVVDVAPGRPDAPALREDALIAAESPLELNDLLKQARGSLARVDAVALAAERGLGEVNAIAATIRKGEGSLGKFVQDDEAYRKLNGLSDRGEQALLELKENLAAMKRTWPLSRYFDSRAFYDRDRLLFHPGAERDRRTLHQSELFEPGRAVLTAAGRLKLDEVGIWFNKVKRPTTEVVIAAFTDEPRAADRALILTQEQAEAVRKYLATRHGLDGSGWFANRKVAAVGFGNEPPPPAEGAADAEDLPPRRVEVILFTPQA